MSDEYCPLPGENRSQDRDEEALATMIRGKRIAVVGLSDRPNRAAGMIARYLLSIGREVFPVNPNYTVLVGLKCYPSVSAIGSPVDVVDVFRRAEFCPAIVEDAIAAHAGGVWLQSGIVSIESRRLAEEAGIEYVEDRCLMVEIRHANAT